MFNFFKYHTLKGLRLIRLTYAFYCLIERNSILFFRVSTSRHILILEKSKFFVLFILRVQFCGSCKGVWKLPLYYQAWIRRWFRLLLRITRHTNIAAGKKSKLAKYCPSWFAYFVGVLPEIFASSFHISIYILCMLYNNFCGSFLRL